LTSKTVEVAVAKRGCTSKPHENGRMRAESETERCYLFTRWNGHCSQKRVQECNSIEDTIPKMQIQKLQ